MHSSSKWLVFAVLLALLLPETLLPTADAYSEITCNYRNLEGKNIVLRYFEELKLEQDYVDFDKNGLCHKRAVCKDPHITVVEDCAKYKITCANQDSFTGVFPGCCIKCP
ncbi:uncharacterized protein LOC108091201 [Drosophila ficusphila]|uniref:uncharacterized protein LOC108091201 n=1 Tax=Drosophila ficusphila TaxID=30025 RepID=UPI0007E85BDC|nr:uncharacterized protein LOC108091201 [Drosophila ficusphila]